MGLSVLALALAAHRGIRGASGSVLGPAFMALWGIEWLASMLPIERQTHSFSGNSGATIGRPHEKKVQRRPDASTVPGVPRAGAASAAATLGGSPTVVGSRRGMSRSNSRAG